MPELPEVETIKRGLVKNIIGKKMINFSCDWPKMINKSLEKYQDIIKRKQIKDIRRRAKMLIIDLTDDWHILIHLKMTGQLVYSDKVKCLVGGHPIAEGYQCLPNKFTHATFSFSDNSHLYFNDIRKFGWLRLFNSKELEQELDNLHLGLEPLSLQFTLKYFQDVLARRPQNKIKQFLMDSKFIVGIGNIYSDEVCFYAKVKPNKMVKNITAKEVKLLYQGIIKILKASIKDQGTTFSDFRNADGEVGGYSSKLKVYGRYNMTCKVCKNKILKIKIGGRTSSFCPYCQS
jgi:formamidopyrimidine-DNA glycosylase